MKHNKNKIRSILKIHGGKYYLARRIIKLFPESVSLFIDPFCGAGNIILNIDKSKYNYSIISDIDPLKINVLRIIRDDHKALMGILSNISYTSESFNDALLKYDKHDSYDYNIGAAVQYIVVNRMSRGGLCTDFAWSNRLRGGNPGDVNAWNTAIKMLPSMSAQLSKTEIIKSDFRFISSMNLDSKALVYLDPPYLLHKRVSKNAYGKHELTNDDHELLAKIINNLNCNIFISGYDSDEYSSWFTGWDKIVFDVPNHSGQNKCKQRRLEVVWYKIVK